MQTRYVLEEGVTASLGSHLAGLGSRCLVLCDRHPSDNDLVGLRVGIMRYGAAISADIMRIERPRCSKPAARELAETILQTHADLVVAYGASKILDLARAALRCLGPDRPALALVPTVVSSNACVGSLAVMYGDDGLPSGFWKLDRPPELIAVDPQLVASSSLRLLASALGDQIASSLEAIHCAGLDSNASGIADHRLALETIQDHGALALSAVDTGVVDEHLLKVLRAVTYYSPEQEACAGANLCHVLGAAVAADSRSSAFTHGEVVGAFVPAELVFAGEELQVACMVRLMAGFGLPLGLSGLGIAPVDEEGVSRLVRIAASSLIGQGSAIAANSKHATSAVLKAEELIREAHAS